MERSTVVLTRKGQELHVTVRPITRAHLARVVATDAMPSQFAEPGPADSPQALKAGLEFLRAFVVAGTLAVRAGGRLYRLALEPDPARDDILTPEDLEEPGLEGGEPFGNVMTLARAIAELSGMEHLFRGQGGDGEVAADGN